MKAGFIGGGNMGREPGARNCEAVTADGEAASHSHISGKVGFA